jgi:signal peptidase
MCKAQGNKLVVVMTVLLFIFLDISTTLYFGDFSSNYKILTFIGLTLLPAVSSNIVFSYITLMTGYKPIILYASVMGLYQYVLPVIPNPDEYLSSIIRFLLPVVLCYRIYGFFHNNYDKELEREYRKKSVLPLAGVSLVVCLLVYFTSGYFHYWAIAIATGSMDPVIKKGDVAIVKKIDDNYHQLKVGDVIAFRYQNVVIVHRIINIIQEILSLAIYQIIKAEDATKFNI